MSLMLGSALIATTLALAVPHLSDDALPSMRLYDVENSGIPENIVQSVVFDRAGRLWIGTQAGAASSNGKTWQSLRFPAEARARNTQTIWSDADDSLLFGTGGGGLVAWWQQKHWGVYGVEHGLPSADVRAVHRAGDGTLYIGTTKGLARWNGVSFEPVSVAEHPSTLVTALASQRGELCVGTELGLFCLKDGRWSGSTVRDGLPDARITTLAYSGAGLWIGTHAGLALRTADGVNDQSVSAALVDKQVTSISVRATAEQERVFVGSYDGMLVSYEARVGYRRLLSGERGPVRALCDSPVSNDPRYLWMGLEIGLARLSENDFWTFEKPAFLQGATITVFAELEADVEYWVGVEGTLARWRSGVWTTYSPIAGLARDTVWTLLKRPSTGELLAGTQSGRLLAFDGKAWRERPTIAPKANNGLFALAEDRTGNLWMGRWQGLEVHYADGRRKVLGLADGLPSESVVSLLPLADKLLLGTSVGVALLQDGVAHEWLGSSQLPREPVLGLAGWDDAVWVSGFGSGAYQVRDDKLVQHWSETSTPALPNNYVYQTLKARDGFFAFSNKGVSYVTEAHGAAAPSRIFSFTKEDGLPSNELAQGASLVDAAGRVWAGTAKGLAVFDPQRFVPDRVSKPLLFERVVAGKTELGISGVSDLNYQQNNLSFEYALLSYAHESGTQFSSQMIGLESEASEWQSDNRRVFTTLPSGDYEFKVWGRDAAGNVSGPIAKALRVTPAPWRTWWAYTSYFVAVAGVSVLASRARIRRLQQRALELEAKVEARTVEVRQQASELAKRADELSAKNVALEASYQEADRIFAALKKALKGRIIEDRFEIGDTIGEGGFGAVYRATEVRTGAQLAIKIFKPASGNESAESLERFKREAANALKLDHPNVVKTLDSGFSDDGIPYLTMELLVGHPLSALIGEDHRIGLRRALNFTRQTCEALVYAHNLGIVHRDIKPENIFIVLENDIEVVKLLDFGVAKVMTASMRHSLTMTGAVIGTPTYIAPERLVGEIYDGRADIYSVGIMLYRMLTGQVPFESVEGNVFSIVTAHLQRPPPVMTDFDPTIPATVQDLVMTMLCKDPNERPTAIILASMLDRVARELFTPTE